MEKFLKMSMSCISCDSPCFSAAQYHPVLFPPAFYECKKRGERKLISNKRLTEWLLFCPGHVVWHTCQVLCGANNPPFAPLLPGLVLRGKVHDERPRVGHQRAHWDPATSRTEGHSVDRGNVTPSDRSSIQPTQGHADRLARRGSGALSFTCTDSLPADPRLKRRLQRQRKGRLQSGRQWPERTWFHR